MAGHIAKPYIGSLQPSSSFNKRHDDLRLRLFLLEHQTLCRYTLSKSWKFIVIAPNAYENTKHVVVRTTSCTSRLGLSLSSFWMHGRDCTRLRAKIIAKQLR